MKDGKYSNLVHSLSERWWPLLAEDTEYGQAKAIAYDKYRPSEDRDIRVFAIEHLTYRLLHEWDIPCELVWWPGAPCQYESCDLWVTSQYSSTPWIPDSGREKLDVKTILHGHDWSENTFHSSMDYLLGWERLDNTAKFAFFLPRKIIRCHEQQIVSLERESLMVTSLRLAPIKLVLSIWQNDMIHDFLDSFINPKSPLLNPPLFNLPIYRMKNKDNGNEDNHHQIEGRK